MSIVFCPSTIFIFDSNFNSWFVYNKRFVTPLAWFLSRFCVWENSVYVDSFTVFIFPKSHWHPYNSLKFSCGHAKFCRSRQIYRHSHSNVEYNFPIQIGCVITLHMGGIVMPSTVRVSTVQFAVTATEFLYCRLSLFRVQ